MDLDLVMNLESPMRKNQKKAQIWPIFHVFNQCILKSLYYESSPSFCYDEILSRSYSSENLVHFPRKIQKLSTWKGNRVHPV